MKRVVAIIFCLGLSLSGIACQSSPNRAPEGAAIGGIIGAGIGAIIGHQSGETGEGAAVGAAAGALTGALAGSQMQKPAQSGQQQSAQRAPSPNQMSVQQIVEMSNQGVHEDVIIDRIRLTDSRFNLKADDLNYLRQNKVSEKVIAAMQGW